MIEYRYGEGKVDRLSDLAAELAKLKVNVIVTAGSQATRPAKKATATIPIVMAQDNDPVGSGIRRESGPARWQRHRIGEPDPELSGKQLEILKESLPKLARLAMLSDLTEPGNPQAVSETDRAAQGFGIRAPLFGRTRAQGHRAALISARVKNSRRVAGDTERRCSMPIANNGRAGGKVNRWPGMYPRADYVDDGGLMTYGIDANDLSRRAAIFVDKILKARNRPIFQ